MEKRNTIVAILRTLILGGLIWLCFIIAQMALNHPRDEQEIYAPKSAKSVLWISADTLVSESFLALLFNRDDEEQVALIISVKNKFKSSESQQNLNFGIDLSNDIQVFTDHFKGENLKGFIFRLKDTKIWDENSGDMLNRRTISYREGTTGIVLQSNELSKNELISYYKKNSFKENYWKNSKSPISFQYKNQANKAIKNVKTNFSLESNQIVAALNADISKETVTGKRKFELEEGGFHIQSSFVPNFISDTLNVIAKKFDLSFPKIRSVDLKYDGIEIATTNSGVVVLPTVEAIIEFEANFSVSDFVQKMAQNNQKLIKIDANSFIIAKKTYFFKQLDSNTIYVGSTKKPRIIIPKSRDLISITGDPKMLTNIQGNRFMKGLIKMNDDYKKIAGVLNRLENLDVRINRKNETKLVGTGKLTFVEKRKTMNELFKSMLSLF